MIISAHCLVKNEENFIWYTVMSVIDYVDNISIWDTGSTDKTVLIIKKIQKKYPNKILFKQYSSVSGVDYFQARQKMLEETTADWVLVLDGDEVWWEDSIKNLVETINKKGKEIETIVVRTVNLVGDIYHYQEASAARYEIAGRKGHINLRAFSTKIPGLHVGGNYPGEGYFDDKGRPIQNRDPKKNCFLDTSYFHLTHLKRSDVLDEVIGRKGKFKYEIGISFPLDFYFPEVFFRSKPSFVPPPWRKLEGAEYFRAAFETPLKKLKRIL
ncbi:MAG: glycosyltransferase [bacterium]